MKLTAIDRMRTLPVHRDDEVWEVGWVEFKPPKGAAAGSIAQRRLSMACASATRDGGAMERFDSPTEPDGDLALRVIAKCALEPHVPGARPWNYLPSKIEVGVLPPEIKRQLDEFFGPLNVVVEVKPRLRKIEEVTEHLNQMIEEIAENGPNAGPPGLMTVPGMTLERVRSFAEAGRVFFDAKPWKAFEGCDDVWEIRPAPPWPQLNHCLLMGELAELFGVAFFKSLQGNEDFAQLGMDLEPEEVLEHLHDTYWSVGMNELAETPMEDAMLWQRESLPTCGKQMRVAVPIGVSKGGAISRPTPEMLGFMEAVLLALASVKRADVRAGFFERTVKAGSGTRTLSFTAHSADGEVGGDDGGRAEPAGEPSLSKSALGPLAGRVIDLSPESGDLDELIELLKDTPLGKKIKQLRNRTRGAQKPAKSKRRAPARPLPVKAAAVYQIKVTLNTLKPPIWRRFLVRDDATLADLHDALQAAFGWWDGHLHEFTVNGERYSRPHPGMCVDSMWSDNETIDSSNVRLSDLGLAPKRKFGYVYDFGDNWEFTLAVEKLLSATDAEAAIARQPGAAAVWKKFTAATRTPAVACIAGARRGPPEDCGGVWGYAELCEIMADPKHPEREERCEWLGLEPTGPGGGFDPEEFDLARINRSLSGR